MMMSNFWCLGCFFKAQVAQFGRHHHAPNLPSVRPHLSGISCNSLVLFAHAGVIMDSPRPASDDSRSSSSSNGLPKRPIDPITRTALRYTISPREYELLHQYLISRAPERVQKRTPNPTRYEKITKSASDTGDYNVATLRTALRLFAGAFTGLKTWELVSSQIASRRGGAS
jgi:hypothetical protein